MLGFPNNFNAQLPTLHGGPVQFKYGSWAAYIQDEWRVRRNIALTLGLRYDYLTQPKTTDGRLWNSLDLANQKWTIGATEMPPLCSAAQSAPCIPDAFKTDPHFGNVVVAGTKFFAPPPIKDNWGPRIGVAWTLNPKTVIRAGYGLYWDPLPARSQYAQNDLEATVWPDATAFSGNANASANFTNGTAFNIIQIQGQGFATPLPTTNPWSVSGFPNDPNYKDPYSQQWHVEVQREVSSSSMVSVAYVGSKNGRLPYAGFANAARQASPNGTPNSVVDALRLMPWAGAGFTYTTNIGYSNYNALETKFQRRFTKGLSTLISYTWSKSIDVSSGYFNVENGRAAVRGFRITTIKVPRAVCRHTTFRISSPGQRSMNFRLVKASVGLPLDPRPGFWVTGRRISLCRLVQEHLTTFRLPEILRIYVAAHQQRLARMRDLI